MYEYYKEKEESRLRVITEVKDLISKNSWLQDPVFRWGDNEGYKDGRFGIAAGPSYNVANLMHEIAHSIDFALRGKEERLQYYNYGLGAPPDNKMTLAPSTLECRVVAIQRHLLEMIGTFGDTPEDLDAYASYFGQMFSDYMCDWYLGSPELRRELILAFYNQYSKEEILVGWNSVLKYKSSLKEFDIVMMSD